MDWLKGKVPPQTNEEYWKEFADELVQAIENGTGAWQKGWKPGEIFVPERLTISALRKKETD